MRAPAVPTPDAPTPETPSAYYRSCAEARAAGAAPLHRGDPGYRSGLDRDGDGVACEK
ncbi:excalibur calcium-binding domain-containing protein [Nocardia otitidiscaviarum]|uniref:excalibur calcium-binding domain-containing protein n=1 Tax=Nocardia otitidiscaviarum TaxID=1823 RepID=UPI002B4AFCAC|nr:excalibur calcium-binding domain-containing protein [Nocardia otitidiscaviarum]